MILKFFLLVCIYFLKNNISKKSLSCCLHCPEKQKLSLASDSAKELSRNPLGISMVFALCFLLKSNHKLKKNFRIMFLFEHLQKDLKTHLSFLPWLSQGKMEWNTYTAGVKMKSSYGKIWVILHTFNPSWILEDNKTINNLIHKMYK